MFHLATAGLFLADIVTDILVIVQYYNANEMGWFAAAMSIVGLCYLVQLILGVVKRGRHEKFYVAAILSSLYLVVPYKCTIAITKKGKDASRMGEVSVNDMKLVEV